MIFQSKFAVGAFLIALGSTVVGANDEQNNLRGGLSEQQELPEAGDEDHEDRELAPFNNGNGFGFTTNNNRFTNQRTRGKTQGTNFLRPYTPARVALPPAGVVRSPQMVAGPKVAGPKVGKSFKAGGTGPAKVGKAGNGTPGKVGKSFKGFQPMPPPVAPLPSQAQSQRGFLNQMNWQRVPGQPIFVSQTNTPIVILDEQPQIFVDESGNTILLDTAGNEIIIALDQNGNPVIIQVGEDGEIPVVVVDNGGTDSARFPLKATNKPTSGPTSEPTSEPTRSPTLPPTSRPSSKPSKKPSSKPSQKPSKNPTNKPSKKPSSRPSNRPSKNPTKQPTKEPTKEPTASPSIAAV